MRRAVAVPAGSSLVKLAQRLGVEIRPGRMNFRHCPAIMRVAGNYENGFAWLASPTVVAYDAHDREEGWWPADDIFHELMHAICGPECLKDEAPLMPVQWELMKLLSPDEFAVCRRDFGAYTLAFDDENTNGGVVGHTNHFLESRVWADLTDLAMATRLLTQKAKPNWRYLKDPAKWRPLPRKTK